MGKENKKSPLEQSTDKRYNRPTYTGMGTTMQNRLMDGAYISARANAPDYSWMGAVGAGVKAFKEDYDAKQVLKTANREEAYGKIDKIAEGIYEAGGSLPEAYFDQAFDFTQELREKYVEAVESGDTKLQHKLKGQLNTFSTAVQTVKSDLTTGAELWKDGSLINKEGFTAEQISIQESVFDKNAVLEEGVYKWKNVNWNPNNPKSKEFYTMDDYKNSQPLRDVATESYLKSNSVVIEASEKWKTGEGSDFSFKNQYEINEKLVTKENIQSMLWDDVSNQGSFAGKYLDTNPDFKSIFDTINKDENGMTDLLSIGMYDGNKDGVVDYRDFIDPNTPEGVAFFEKYDDPYNETPGVIDDDELQTIMQDDDALEAIKEISKSKLKSALTDVSNDKFDFNTSKRLVTDFFTRRQQQMFYGDGKSIHQYGRMVPDQSSSRVKIGTDKDNKGKLMLNDGTVITDEKDYIKKGGSISLLDEMGWSWNPKSKMFEHNANWENITQKTTTKSR